MSFVGNNIRRLVSAPVWNKVYRTLRYTPRDVLDLALGETDPLVPPRRKIFIGGPLFRAIGDEFFGYFLKYGEIKPQHRILDIGCGIGRMSRPLVSFLDPARGRFEGFDIDADGIKWCQDRYAAYPHFRFQRVDIFNKFYNPSGRLQADTFAFPYAESSFDFAFATSVFTHMLLSSVNRYLQEIARVLVPGGRALLTAFLWNAEAKDAVAQGKATRAFREHGDLIVADPLIPEDAIALRQPDWEAAVRAAGLEAVGKVQWGSWCGRSKFLSYQDVVVVRKPDGAKTD